jgi:hypothetical protein
MKALWPLASGLSSWNGIVRLRRKYIKWVLILLALIRYLDYYLNIE